MTKSNVTPSPKPFKLFENMADEVIFHMFSFFNPKDLYKVGLTNKRLHRISDDERLWSHLYSKYIGDIEQFTMGGNSKNSNENQQSIKQKYISKNKELKSLREHIKKLSNRTDNYVNNSILLRESIRAGAIRLAERILEIDPDAIEPSTSRGIPYEEKALMPEKKKMEILKKRFYTLKNAKIYTQYALQDAIWMQHIPTIKLMLGKDNLYINGDGSPWPPLSIAVKIGNLEIVKLLVARKAMFGSAYQSQYGQSHLHLAAATGNEELIKYVITKIEELENVQAINNIINNKDYFGNTALHYAASTNLSVFCYLIDKYGASKTICHVRQSNKSLPALQSKTPYQIATERFGHSAVNKALKNNGKLSSTKSASSPMTPKGPGSCIVS